jgi:hypothetical protein
MTVKWPLVLKVSLWLVAALAVLAFLLYGLTC